MTKRGFFIILFICFIGIVVKFAPTLFSAEDHAEVHIEIHEFQRNIDDKDVFESKQISKSQVYEGNLVLVNHDYAVHEEAMNEDIVNLTQYPALTKGYGLINDEIYLSKELAQKFADMIHAAREDGVNQFLITSGYRSFAEQDKLYQKMGPQIALPAGYSEHHLGLSLDVGSSQSKMESAPEGKWIENHAWKYGFILRYPEGKSHITGIQYEPWHIRYVGMPHSAIMHKKSFVLEQYLDYLKEVKELSVHINGENYFVAYYPYTEGLTIDVPLNKRYTISGDNMNGIILTVYE